MQVGKHQSLETEYGLYQGLRDTAHVACEQDKLNRVLLILR